MITCPACKHEEYYGALFCSECGKPISISQKEESTINIDRSKLRERDFDKENKLKIPPSPSEVKDCIIALQILDSGKFIYIKGRDDFILGRATKGQSIIPDIDLNSFDAYDKGVSRLHANINIQGEIVSIKDLDSANGTWINGKIIDPQKEYIIKHRDIVTLGQLQLQILINSKLEK